MAQDHANSYSRFVLAQSRRHRDTICALPFSADLSQHFDRLAQESRSRQREIEEADTMPFEIYRQQYLDPKRLGILRNHGE